MWLRVLLLLSLAPAAASDPLCFTPVITTREPGVQGLHLGSSHVNAAGSVSFVATLDGGSSVVMRQDSAARVPIADDSGEFDSFGDPTVLGAGGAVAVKAFRGDGTSALVRGDGGPLETLVSVPEDVDSIRLRFAVDGFGRAVFVGRLGGVDSLLRTTPTGPELLHPGSNLHGFLRPDANGVGEFAFLASVSGAEKVFRSDGVVLTELASTGGTVTGFGAEGVALDEAGRVAFLEVLTGGGERIRLADGVGAPVTVVTTGPDFDDLERASLAPDGTFRFRGRRPDGAWGIYSGPDPTLDAIVETGFELDGSTVKSVVLARDAVDDAGTTLFGATLDDGTQGLYRAFEGVGCPDPSPRCANGSDDDGDGATDHPEDPGCASAHATLEDPACNDGVDNDGDGWIDLADPQCETSAGTREQKSKACGLGAEGVLLLAPLWAVAWRRRRVTREPSPRP